MDAQNRFNAELTPETEAEVKTLLEIADKLGIRKGHSLQEWAAREAIEALSFMWKGWPVSLTETEFKNDVQLVISSLEDWRDAVIQKGLIKPAEQSDV